MDAPTAPDLGPLATRVRTLTHDLHMAREHLAAGKIRPDHYAALSKILERRLRELEVEAHVRLLSEVKQGRVAWQPPRHGGS